MNDPCHECSKPLHGETITSTILMIAFAICVDTFLRG